MLSLLRRTAASCCMHAASAACCRMVDVGGITKNAPPPPVGGNVNAVLPAPDNGPTAAVELLCCRSPVTSAIGLSLLRQCLLLSTSAVPACIFPAPPLVVCILHVCTVVLIVLCSVCLRNGHGGQHHEEPPAAAGRRRWRCRPPHHRQRANSGGQIIALPLPRNVNDRVVPPPPAPPPVDVRGPILAVPPFVACMGQ